MTKEEAEKLQDLCDEVIVWLETQGPPNRVNWAVNWAGLSCRSVLVNALNPNEFPTLKIEEASPSAWGFAHAVAEEIEKRSGQKVYVETEW